MALIGPIVRNEIFFFVTILALAGWMILMDWRSRGPAPVAGSAADRRLAAWTERRERLWMGLVSTASFLFIMLVTAEFIYAKNGAALSPSKPMVAENGVVRVPIADLADGDLHRYEFTSPEGTTRFFLIARPGMDPAAVVDACEVCGGMGYGHEGGNVICKNCGAAIYVPSIGTLGGCNPIPLEHKTSSSEVEIPVEALVKSTRFFTAH
jgi:high-affinity iron transporter